MVKKWTIYDMDDKTKQAIKNKAKDFGCTIPYLLTLTFNNSDLESKQGQQSWTIHNLSYQDIDYIKRGSASSDKSIALFLKDTIKQAKATLQDKNRTKELLKELLENLYSK